MGIKKLIEKYELDNKMILSNRPDLETHGDFTTERTTYHCNSMFIEDLKALAKPTTSEEPALNIADVRHLLPSSEVIVKAKYDYGEKLDANARIDWLNGVKWVMEYLHGNNA